MHTSADGARPTVTACALIVTVRPAPKRKVPPVT
jgi:hypothetical protein